MRISEVAIARPVFASMVILALVVFGVVSYGTIGVDLYPDVEIPVVTITVPYEGADPRTVEMDVTDVIEESVNTISGIKSLRSESVEGMSQVFVEFELEEDVDLVSQDVRDKVAKIRGDLPLAIESPIIEKFDFNSSPILAIVISGPASMRELTDYADDVVKIRLESAFGVGNVRLVGGREREIRVWLSAEKLRAHELAAKDITDALKRENIEPPGGRVETGSREMTVKTGGKFDSIDDFENLVIANRQGTLIRLTDVAEIEDGLEDARSLARLDGRRAVSLLVRRQSGKNLVEVAEGVKLRVDELRSELPEGFQLTVAQDLSVFVEQSISEAEGELIRGGVLAVLVILLFLRSVRGSLVAAITIPATIISTFSFMMAMGFSINMMSMLALTISVGMIIDDSIVVLENTYRHMEAGMPRMEAARTAISEIGFAVIATSLAIVAVFVPVAFMDGIVGRFFYEFGLTVTFAVVISTFIAVTLSPMLCSRLLKVSNSHNRVFDLSERILQLTESIYRRVLRTALRWRLVVAPVAFLVFVASLGITAFLGQEFIPPPDESQFNVRVQTPVGSSLEATSEAMTEVERRMRALPGVINTFTTIGSGVEQRVNTAILLVRLTPKSRRAHSQGALMDMARDKLADLKRLKLSVENVPRVSGGGFSSAPVQYNIRGADLDEMVEWSEAIVEKITADVQGVVDLNSSYDSGKPVVRVEIDRDKANNLGISTEDLGDAVRTLIGGEEVGAFEQDGETHAIRVRLAEVDRDRPDAVLDVPVRTASGRLTELGNVAQIRESTGPVQISRQNRTRQITLFAGLEKDKPLAAAKADILKVQDDLGVPQGVSATFTGDAEMMEDSFAAINFSLMMAVVLIYMVLAAQFESLVHPFTVMLSLPLSIVGALGLLAITGRTLNIFSMIGMIMLMGLVTKNAILLIDYTNLLRRRGMSRDEALMTAGPVRLRPILMTALSTIAGMIPVAIGLGEGAESRAPMGTVIVGGLVTSTVLTLVVIPVVYSLMDDLAAGVRWLLFGSRALASDREEVHMISDEPDAA